MFLTESFDCLLERSELPDDIEELKNLFISATQGLTEKIEHLTETIDYLQSQLSIMRRFQYGQRSERLKRTIKLANDNSVEIPIVSCIKTKKPSNKDHPGRNPLPLHLPREKIVHDLLTTEKVCSHCGAFLSQIGFETSEQLETIPINFIVKQHKRLKYACKGCGETMALAKSPSQAIEKGIAGPHLIAQVLVDKYADHLPLYRQEQRFKRHNIHINRSTLWNWVYLSSLSLSPLVDVMRQDLLLIDCVSSDDTTMPTLREQVLENRGKKAKTNYIWVYTGSSADKRSPIVLYDFTQGRDGCYPEGFLKNFTGYVQADAYAGYNGLFTKGSCVRLGCWAHVRRKFYDALKANPKSIAKQMMAMIGKLYKTEGDCRKKCLQVEQIKEKRQHDAKPILQEIHAWLIKHKSQVVPKSLLGQAIAYALSNWQALNVYVEDGRLEIDNNRSERCIKRVVLGRKNYLFMGSIRGGKAAAIIYSLIETCKQNDVDPAAYLADVLSRIPTHPNKHIHELLPYNWKSPTINHVQIEAKIRKHE